MHQDRSKQKLRFGSFEFSPGRHVNGELLIDGAASHIRLLDAEPLLYRYARRKDYILGVLSDLTKISLINCISLESGTVTQENSQYHYARLFPHFVIEGRSHLLADQPIISAVSFSFDDAAALFDDHDAFSIVINASSHIKEILSAQSAAIGRQLEAGENPLLAYFTGNLKIIETSTAYGDVLVSHNPRFNIGSADGVRIENQILVRLRFEPVITFSTAIERLLRVLRFLELVVGRPQTLLQLRASDEDVAAEPLTVHWSHKPQRPESPIKSSHEPRSIDALIDVVRQRDEFCSVLRNWIDTDREHQDARGRFFDSFLNQNVYSVQRLIGAANMFDILPSSAAPKKVKLDESLVAARDAARNLFQSLPDSYEKSRALSDLGRIGQATLKQKIRHRASQVLRLVGSSLPDLINVLDAAVDCRNHYVHGSTTKIDFNSTSSITHFLTDALEFTFAASELVESGWKIQRFFSAPTAMSHPFAIFRITYSERLAKFKAAVAAS